MSIAYDHLKEKKYVRIVHSVNILMKMGAKLQYKTTKIEIYTVYITKLNCN